MLCSPILQPFFAKLHWFGGLVLVLVAVGAISANGQPLTRLLQAGDVIGHHMQVLGHDSLKGRATGTLSGDRAAAYIADVLRTAGLRPVGDQGGYFQGVPMHASLPMPESILSVHQRDSATQLALNDDYLLLTGGSQIVVPIPLPMVFVGYGIVAPEYDYNDYQELDVRG